MKGPTTIIASLKRIKANNKIMIDDRTYETVEIPQTPLQARYSISRKVRTLSTWLIIVLLLAAAEMSPLLDFGFNIECQSAASGSHHRNEQRDKY